MVKKTTVRRRAIEKPIEPVDADDLRGKLRLLYHGHSPAAVRFQFAVLLIDLVILGFFVASPLLRGRPAFYWIDYSIAAVVIADMVARMLASTDIPRWLRQPTSIIDMIILVTLLAPDWLSNFGFLRVLRLWTLSRNRALWKPLKKYGLEAYEDAARSVVNLLTFLFVVSGFVYTFFAHPDSGIGGYIDALYYTVATITTTGFGDIVLPGAAGKLTSIIVMIIGISLFVRLAQAIFSPHKVTFPCPQCGLRKHDADAVHCKACGHLLKIPDEGH